MRSLRSPCRSGGWWRIGAEWAAHTRAGHSLLNGAGAIATSLTVLVVVVSKFTEGAWITVIIIPLFMAFYLVAHCSHERMDRALMSAGTESTPLSLEGVQPPVVIVLIRRLDRVARKGLRFALSVSHEVQAVLVVTEDATADEQCAAGMRASWHDLVDVPAASAGYPPVAFVTLPSAYREFRRRSSATCKAWQRRTPTGRLRS